MRPAIFGFAALLSIGCVPVEGGYYDPSPYPGYATYPAYGAGTVYYAGGSSWWDRCRSRYSESYCREQVRDRDHDDDDDRRRGNRRDRDDDNDRDRRRAAEREQAQRDQARREQAQREQARREQERRGNPGVTRDGWENSRAGDHARSEFNRLSGKGE